MDIRMMRIRDRPQMRTSKIHIRISATAATPGRGGSAGNFEEGESWILWYSRYISNVGAIDGDDSGLHMDCLCMYIVRARESMYIAIRSRRSRNRRGYEFCAVIEDQTGPVRQNETVQRIRGYSTDSDGSSVIW